MPNNMQLDRIIRGNCIESLAELPANSVDVIFADPPYNLQLQSELYRPNMTKVDAVDDEWDQFDDLAAYDEFTSQWLSACRRVLKDTGTIWVIGSYHNIFRVGTIIMDLGYWILNSVEWVKTNPMPNFKGTRFTNAHETLIWAQKCKGARYTFNYQAMKTANDDKQMRSIWELPICSGSERIMVNGEKAHATQKPEALLYRVLLSSTNPGDVVLDPFFGSGTTGAVAKKLHRHWIGLEQEKTYVEVAQRRIDAITSSIFDETLFAPSNKPKQKLIPFIRLIESQLLQPGQQLRFDKTDKLATITADGALSFDGERGSIHKVGTKIQGAPCNGWAYWYYKDQNGLWASIDELRQQVREQEQALV